MTTEGEDYPSRLSRAGVSQAVKLLDLGGGRKIPISSLKQMLPDVETALFFAKAYDLDYSSLSELVRELFHTDVVQALLAEGDQHSTDLQGYIADTVPDYVEDKSSIGYSEDVAAPDTVLLKQAWDAALVEVAQSIKDVARKLGDVLEAMPSKYGEMSFAHLRQLNVKRNSIGQYAARVQHQRTAPRLVVLDVSGSMSESTVRRIADEVVGLAYGVDAAMAVVSNTATFWEAGAFTTADVLRAAEYGGTFYEQLVPLFERDWETVITIADYDSSKSVLPLFRKATGRVKQVIDVSLVNRPTFLAECVGQIATEVKPILVGQGSYPMTF